MDALQKRLRAARKRAPNVTTIIRWKGSVFALRWVNERMDVRLLRKA
ncbi:hypothetical protein ACDJ03_19775 [Xanthomonas axonopodis pv. nakataecorchori]